MKEQAFQQQQDLVNALWRNTSGLVGELDSWRQDIEQNQQLVLRGETSNMKLQAEVAAYLTRVLTSMTERSDQKL